MTHIDITTLYNKQYRQHWILIVSCDDDYDYDFGHDENDDDVENYDIRPYNNLKDVEIEEMMNDKSREDKEILQVCTGKIDTDGHGEDKIIFLVRSEYRQLF